MSPRAGHFVLLARFVARLALGATSLEVAQAADAIVPLKAARVAPIYDWNGFYVGGHVGYGGGSFGTGTNPLPQQGAFFSAQHHGPDRRLARRVLGSNSTHGNRRRRY